MNTIERLNMIAEWQEQHKQLIEDLDNSKKRIAELEKENAELKRDYDKRGSTIISLENQLRMYIHSDKTDQLTKAKAKEIIKNLLSSKTDFDERRFALWAWKEEVNKAEQFIKENE